MLKLEPQIIEHEGKKAFIVLPYDDFKKLSEELQCYEDLKDLRAAKAREADAPTISLAEARIKLEIN